MMHHSTYSGKQPVMRRIVEQEDVVRGIVLTTKSPPTFTNKSSYSCFLHGFENKGGKLVGIVNHNTTETDIYRWFPGF